MTATEASNPTTNTPSLPSMPCATPLHACACLSFVQPFYLFSSHFVWPSLSFFCNFSAQLRTERALMRKRKRNMPLHWPRQCAGQGKKGGWGGRERGCCSVSSALWCVALAASCLARSSSLALCVLAGWLYINVICATPPSFAVSYWIYVGSLISSAAQWAKYQWKGLKSMKVLWGFFEKRFSCFLVEKFVGKVLYKHFERKLNGEQIVLNVVFIYMYIYIIF